MALYSDKAYNYLDHIVEPFMGANLNAQQEQFNTLMSPLRSSVEWGYGKIIGLFAFVDFHKNQKVFLQPLGDYFCLAAILANCHTCLYGSEVCSFFGCAPPNLEDYLA